MKWSKWIKLMALITTMLLIGVGCSQRSATQNTAPAAQSAADYAYSLKSDTATIQGAAAGTTTEDGSINRKVIQTGHMELEVLDFSKATDEITDLVHKAGGYIESTSSRKTSEGRIFGSLTIRVPQDKFAQLLVDLSKSGQVIFSEVSGKDVTEQYIDLEARLNNAKAQEVRMLAILEKAEKLEDLLKIEAELARIRGEVEAMQGKFNYLKQSVDLASLTLSIREVDSFATKVKTPGAEIWERIQRSFISSLNMIIDLAVGAVVAVLGFSPLIILLGALFLLARRLFRGRLSYRRHQGPKDNGPGGTDGIAH